ncbi:MAG: cobalamin-dependent protein [bacterium]
MRITLIYPPGDFGVGSEKLTQLIDMAPPLGLAYIAAVLERAGHEVRIIDAKIESLSLEGVLKRVEDFNPDIVGISIYTADFCMAVSLASQLKKQGSYTIIVGGAHVSALPEEVMQQDCFDYGVVGEGERTVVELVDVIS